MNEATSIIIPVLNEEKNILKLVRKIKSFLTGYKYEIIFIDDNSNDNSQIILNNLRKNNKNLSYYIRKKNKDLSQSCIYGFEKSKYKNVLVMDGDLQHNPKYLPKMINKFNKDNLDFLVGSRDFKSAKKEGLSLVRFYSSKIIILIFFLVVGKQTIDPMSGFFIFKKKIYTKNKSKLFGRGYKILSDLIYSSHNEYKIKDIIIKFETRKRGKSKMSFKILIQLIRFIILTTLRRINFK